MTWDGKTMKYTWHQFITEKNNVRNLRREEKD